MRKTRFKAFRNGQCCALSRCQLSSTRMLRRIPGQYHQLLKIRRFLLPRSRAGTDHASSFALLCTRIASAIDWLHVLLLNLLACQAVSVFWARLCDCNASAEPANIMTRRSLFSSLIAGDARNAAQTLLRSFLAIPFRSFSHHANYLACSARGPDGHFCLPALVLFIVAFVFAFQPSPKHVSFEAVVYST